jgi:hypothetical protein
MVGGSNGMNISDFMRSGAPAVRARRYFRLKLAAVYLWAAVLIGVAVLFESLGLLSDIFSQVLFFIVFATSAIVLGVAWKFSVPCPRCGWNIYLTNKPWLRPAVRVPSLCPNCGLDLERSGEPRWDS